MHALVLFLIFLSVLLVCHRSSISILLLTKLILLGCILHTIASVVIADVVFSVIESIRSSLMELSVLLLGLDLLLLAHALRTLRAVSRMAKRFTFFNLLVNKSEGVVLNLTLVLLSSLLLLLLVKRSHSKLLVSKGLVFAA
jgi:hypothetical protein